MTHAKPRSFFGRLLSGISALATAALALPALPALPAAAGEAYDLTIAGTQVDSGNCDDILGNGIFSFQPGTNTLNINGSYQDDSERIIVSKISGLTINTAQDVTLDNGSNTCILLEADTTITGPGKLTVKGNTGIYASGSLTLTLRGADVDALGYSYGITADMYNETLYISNSSVHATGRYGAVCDFGSGISMYASAITSPEGAEIRTKDIGSAYIGLDEEAAKEVTISKPGVTYPLYIAGDPVTDLNQNDVLGNGVFAYDPGSKMLFVRGDYTCSSTVISNTGVNSLVIFTTADSTLESTGHAGIAVSTNTVITGAQDKKLSVTGYTAGIDVDRDANLQILDTEVSANGQYGIVGNYPNSDYDSLKIVNSKVYASGGNCGAIFGFGDGVTLDHCYDYTHNDQTTGGFYSGDQSPADEVDIRRNGTVGYFPLFISGKRVNDVTANNIFGNGALSYDEDTNTLHVKGNVASAGAVLLNNAIEDLTVSVDKDATLRTFFSIYDVINSSENMTFTGSGKLTVDSNEYGIWYSSDSAEKTLTFSGINADIYGKESGVSANGDFQKLVVRNSTLNISTEEDCTVMFGWYGGADYEGCEMSSPQGIRAYFNSKGNARVITESQEEIIPSVILFSPIKLKITAQPHNQTNVLGYTAKFSLTAEGEGLTYQWQMNSGSGWKNSGGDGATTNTLSIPITTGRNGNKYRCIVTSASGEQTISNEVMLKVKTKISEQPASVTAAIGEVAKFTVAASGVGLTYQWQYNKGDGWKTSNATGAKTNTLSINTAAGYNGYQYRCVINNTNNQPQTSSAATLKVKTKITAQPTGLTKPVGEAAKFTVAATGAGLTYQWQYNKGDGWATSNATGAKTTTLTINTAAGYNGYKYRCVITDANGTKTYSSAATLKVKTTITTQPNGVNTTVGSTAKFTVAATGAGLKYQWQYNSGDGWKNSGASGATTATLSINAKTTYNGWKYRCVITDANSATATSSVATLKIKAAITAQPANVSAAVGDTAKFTVTATGVNLSYQWQYNAGDGWKNSGASGATTATLSISAKVAYNGYQYRCIVTDGNSNKVTSSAATLMIKTKITTQPASVTATAGMTAKFTVAATGVNLKYQWQYNSGDGWKNSGASGATAATLSINAKSTYNGWQYRCVITDGNSGTTNSTAAKLTVK